MGIAEMKRVATRIVVFAFDPSALSNFWLTETYFPEIIELDRKRSRRLPRWWTNLETVALTPCLFPTIV
jgi:hypothetical protein